MSELNEPEPRTLNDWDKKNERTRIQASNRVLRSRLTDSQNVLRDVLAGLKVSKAELQRCIAANAAALKDARNQ